MAFNADQIALFRAMMTSKELTRSMMAIAASSLFVPASGCRTCPTTTCAPGDQEKSSDSEFEQSRLDAIELTSSAATEKLISFVGMVSGPALVSFSVTEKNVISGEVLDPGSKRQMVPQLELKEFQNLASSLIIVALYRA